MTNLRTAWPLGALACGLAGCGPDDLQRAGSTERETPNVVVCNEAGRPEDRELYVLSGMRKKLGDFPDLASEVGSEPPTNCEEARRFYDGYLRYSELYPNFDADQPLGPPPLAPGAPEGPGPKLTVTKVLDGQLPGADFGAYPRSPVVKITQLPSPNTFNDGGGCSGSFIAKNWIATAAHCLAVTKPQSIPIERRNAEDLFGYARWQVDWSDANGDLVSTATLTAQGEDILQHPDPRYIGKNPTRTDPGSSRFDFALLYLREEAYDTALPPRAETGAAMRISIVPPLQTETISAAGYGTGGPTLGPLRTGTFGPPLTIIAGFNTIEREVQSFTEASICKGDSGGPAYKMVNVGAVMQPAEVPFEQAPTTVPVMMAVNSAYILPTACGTNPPDPGCPLPSNCAQPGDSQVWTRVDQYRLFIEERMALWQMGPLFTCREGRPTGATTNTFVECWGTPCEIPTNCAPDEFCRRPSDAFIDASCQVCQGSCSCIVGQCVKGPP
jgi:hypothetical protein